ncbi:hypothetical protein QZH41_010595 [Actinostola sp. cb2023]|nr:hypothetical protein QZH41_010595 [Actinostola sp. cb2023]
MLDTWVTEFMVQYSMDGIKWYDYKEKGKVKRFPGNVNTGIPKSTIFTMPITTRYIRVVLLKKNNGDNFCLRMELYGCEPKEDCLTAVGLEDRRIPDNQLSASSHWNDHVASNARLNNKFKTVDLKPVWGGWCTDKKNKHQYLQIDLGHVRAVSGVATQGYLGDNYVKNYKMNYSLDGQEWKGYTQNGASKTFSGNWDNETVIRNYFTRIFARFIRVNPVSWNPMGSICMRLEIYECLPTIGSVPIVSPHGSSYKVNRTSSLNISCLLSGQENFAFMWMKNGIAVGNTNLQAIRRWKFTNGTTLSILSLRDIKYRDSGSVISCTAWYPGLSINTSRNVHVFVNAPRPVIKVANLKSRFATIGIMDPAPLDTSWYLIRYKVEDDENGPWSTIRRPRSPIKKSSIAYLTIKDLKPFTTYLTEVSSLYKDGDVGPYSIPLSFTTHEDVPTGPPRDLLVEPVSDGHIIISWSVPSYDKLNGRIVKYEVTYKSKTKKAKSLFTKQLQREIKGLERNQRYEITVRAFTRVGPGPYSKYTVYSTETDVKPKSKTTIALEKLLKVTVTTQNAAKVIAAVQNLTTIKDLIEKDVHMTASILSKVVSTNVSSEKVGDNLLKTISNVMDLNTETLSNTQAKYNTSATFPTHTKTTLLTMMVMIVVTVVTVVVILGVEVLVILGKGRRVDSTGDDDDNGCDDDDNSGDDDDNSGDDDDNSGDGLFFRFVKVLETFIEKGGKFSINTENIAVRQQKIKTAFTSMRTSVTAKDNKILINSTTDVTSGSGYKADVSITIPATAFPNNETTNETVYFVYYKSSKLFAPNFHRVVICENGFTSEALQKVERKGLSYTVERVNDRIVTESSPVIAASLRGRQVVNLTQPVIIMFKLPPEMIEANNTKCVWWDFNAKAGRGGWSTAGCDLQEIVNDTIICECDHMTNFAALVDVYGPSSKPCGKHELALSLIAYIGCGLSILGLTLTILTYGFFAKLRKEIAAKILLHLCTALLCVLVVFLAGVDNGVKSKVICQVVAMLIHYFLLVAFMWMFFEAYFMYFAFVKVWNDHGDNILWKCASIAWGVPAVVVVVTIGVDTDSYGGEH